MEIRNKGEIKDEEISKTAKKITTRVSVLFCISAVLIAFFWYYVAAFCAVFKNSQINVIISFIICNAWPFLYCLILTVLRKKSIEKQNETMYKVSQILAYI